MEKETKKILVWVGLSLVGLFLTLLALGYTILMCHESGEISRYSPFCYICVSSAIRNVPLIGLEGEPIYYVNGEYQDGNKIAQASSTVMYSSDKTPNEVIQAAIVYLNSIRYKTEKLGCANYPECPNCCINFTGKNSKVSVHITPKVAIDGYTSAETNLVRVNETFNLKYNYE